MKAIRSVEPIARPLTAHRPQRLGSKLFKRAISPILVVTLLFTKGIYRFKKNFLRKFLFTPSKRFTFLKR